MEVAIAQFTAKTSTAGDVAVMFGFIPDMVVAIVDFDQLAPDIFIWVNFAKYAQWGTERHVKIEGSTGVISTVTTAGQVIDQYDGGEAIATAETTDTDPKHVARQGIAAIAGDTTRPGVLIPKEILTAAAKNIVLALRADK